MIRCHECEGMIADEDLDTGVLSGHVDAGCPLCSATLITMPVGDVLALYGTKVALAREIRSLRPAQKVGV